MKRPPRTAVALAALLTACRPDQAPAPRAESEPPPSPSAAPVENHEAFVAAVDAVAAEALERGPIAGLSIAVQSGGREVLAKGYGFADLETRAPATAETSYPIASVSKRLTAAAILRLVDQGRIGLDDPLHRFFPAATPPIGTLTIRHLLQHTSGLGKGGPAPRAATESVLARGRAGRPQGQDWTYSNYNFSLLGLVIEHVTGRDYATHMEEELARPLGLTGTAYCEDGRPVAGRSRDYLSGRRSLTATDYWAGARFFAAGGMCATVRDLVRLEEALGDGRVVSAAMRDAMQEPARLATGVLVDYGFGTRLGFTGARRKIGHTGGGQGNKAVVARYPDDDVTVVVLLNTERDDATVTATDLEERVERLFFDPQPPGPGSPVPTGVAGEYQEARGPRRRLRQEGNTLVLVPGLGHASASRLLAEDGGLFTAENDATLGIRFWDHGGRTGGYHRYRNGWFTGYAVRSAP